MKKTLALLSLIVLSQHSYAGKIYKYTDADGSIHYSENKPHIDAQEAKLKGISIVESYSGSEKSSAKWKRVKKEKKEKNFLFNDFKIAKPQNEETIWGTAGNIQVSVNLKKIPENYRIKFFLDGLPHGKVKQNSQLISDVIRGEHSLYAQIIESNSRKIIKTTKTVKFHVKQHSKK